MPVALRQYLCCLGDPLHARVFLICAVQQCQMASKSVIRGSIPLCGFTIAQHMSYVQFGDFFFGAAHLCCLDLRNRRVVVETGEHVLHHVWTYLLNVAVHAD